MHPRRTSRAAAGAALLAGVLCLAPRAQAQEDKGKRRAIAVLPLRALAVVPEAAMALEATLRNEVAALPEAQLTSPPALAAALRREKDCLGSAICAAAAAHRAGARELIWGTVSSLGDSFLLDLKLLDARSGQELRRVTRSGSGKQDLLIELVHPAVVELLVPSRYVGGLDVRAIGTSEEETVSASLYVDGKLQGTLPLEHPLEGLAPGQHTVRLTKAGFADATLFVEIRFERTTVARVDLARGALADVAYLPPSGRREEPAKRGAPFLGERIPRAALSWRRIGGFAGLGAGALVAVTAVALQARSRSIAADLNRREQLNQLTVGDASAYRDIDREIRGARVLYGLGAAFALGGVGLLYWDGRIERGRLRLGAAPALEGGAVSLSGRF